MSLLVLPIGLLIGLSLGALGGGGAILTVPALVYLVGQEPRDATTSSLLIVGLAALVALVPHARRGNVRFGQGLAFGALGIAGSLAGSALSARVPPAVLLTAFAALLTVVGALMLRRAVSPTPPTSGEQAAGVPDQRARDARARDARGRTARGRAPAVAAARLGCVAKVVAAATGVGLLTGFFGVGGGFVLVPALVLVLAFEMPTAVGTSLLVIAMNSATALAARAAQGASQLDWPVIAAFTVVAVVGSLIGARVAARLDPRHLARAFGVLLLAVAVYTAVRSVPTLT